MPDFWVALLQQVIDKTELGTFHEFIQPGFKDLSVDGELKGVRVLMGAVQPMKEKDL